MYVPLWFPAAWFATYSVFMFIRQIQGSGQETFLAASLAACFMASLGWAISQQVHVATGKGNQMFVGAGVVNFTRERSMPYQGSPVAMEDRDGFFINYRPALWSLAGIQYDRITRTVVRSASVSAARRQQSKYYVDQVRIPFPYLVLLAALVPITMLAGGAARRRYRKTHGLCLPCGYPLRGLTVNRCPECFTEFDPADVPKD